MVFAVGMVFRLSSIAACDSQIDSKLVLMLEPINQENRNRYKYCTKKCHCVAELGHFHYLNLLKFIASSLDINMDLFANRKCATFLSIHILFPFFFLHSNTILFFSHAMKIVNYFIRSMDTNEISRFS